MFGWYEERKALSGILLWSLNPATSGSVYGLSACVSCDVMTAEWLRRLHWEDIDPPPLNRSSAGRWPHLSQKKRETQTSQDFQQCSCSSCVVVVYSHVFFSLCLFSQEVFEDRVFLEEEPQKGVSTPDPPPTKKTKQKKPLHLQKPNLPGPALSRSLAERKVGGAKDQWIGGSLDVNNLSVSYDS